jgi:hypothetical protein
MALVDHQLPFKTEWLLNIRSAAMQAIRRAKKWWPLWTTDRDSSLDWLINPVGVRGTAAWMVT